MRMYGATCAAQMDLKDTTGLVNDLVLQAD